MNPPNKIWIRWIPAVTLLVSGFFGALGAEDSSRAGKWEPEIRAFEAGDRTNPPPRGAVLFLGSSSIRLWKSLAEDFAEHKVINRGFGGSEIADSVALISRLVIPYKPRLIVFYAGDNDVASGKPPLQVSADFHRLVEGIHSSLPETRVAFISIKPSPSRWKHVENIRTANQLIRDFCEKDPRLIYIDVFHPMLGPDGMPKEELFVADKLHLNSKGYALWTDLVRPHLKQ